MQRFALSDVLILRPLPSFLPKSARNSRIPLTMASLAAVRNHCEAKKEQVCPQRAGRFSACLNPFACGPGFFFWGEEAGRTRAETICVLGNASCKAS